MKALSIRQPYASLIMIGAKPWEYRSRHTRIRGRIAIHAAKTLGRDEKRFLLDPEIRAKLRAGGLDPENLPRGCVIGTAELHDSVDADTLPEPHRRTGVYGWGMRAPRFLATPAPAKGALSFWTWDDSDSDTNPEPRSKIMTTATTAPTVTLTSYSLGEAADEAFFDVWAAYVAQRIDERCGFAVSVDQARFGESGEDRIADATDEQAETIREALWALWEAGCAENFGRPSVELDTPNGPRVEYGAEDDTAAVMVVAEAHGFAVDFSNQVKLDSGRYRAPLVLAAERRS